MKTFRYEDGHVANITMTVGELIEKLTGYPRDMPVLATWENIKTVFDPANFSVESFATGHEEDRAMCLIIGVDQY